MQITDFPTDTTNEYSKLKRLLVNAVDQTKGHVNKMIWLNLILNEAQVASAAGTTIQVHEWTQDPDSEQSVPGLTRELTNALSRNSIKSAADNVLFTAILAAADTALNA